MSGPARVRARVEPSLGARVIARTPLLYRDGAHAARDRPAHVRAGSALARIDAHTLAVVQDDASFVAILEGVGTRRGARGSADALVVRDVPLPSGGGVRQVTVAEAAALYAAMRSAPIFCGSELSVEGAALAGDDVLLLQRGNGAPCDGRGPVRVGERWATDG